MDVGTHDRIIAGPDVLRYRDNVIPYLDLEEIPGYILAPKPVPSGDDLRNFRSLVAVHKITVFH